MPGLSWSARRALIAKWIRQKRPCAYCNQPATTIDHVIPLVRGGTSYEGNLTPACLRCNSAKGRKLISEWRAGRAAGRTWTPRRVRVKSAPSLKVKSTRGEQVAFNICPECGALCVNIYCDNTCNSRFIARRNYRLRAGIPLDAPLHSNGAPRGPRIRAA